jgi:hypothetical protein
MPIHVVCTSGEAKFWLEPVIELARNHGLNDRQLCEVESLIEVHEDELVGAWRRHFES